MIRINLSSYKERGEAVTDICRAIMGSTCGEYVKSIILFGSTAKGTFRKKSDIDLAIVVYDALLPFGDINGDFPAMKTSLDSITKGQSFNYDLQIIWERELEAALAEYNLSIIQDSCYDERLPSNFFPQLLKYGIKISGNVFFEETFYPEERFTHQRIADISNNI